jgi:hypothetical protein
LSCGYHLICVFSGVAYPEFRLIISTRVVELIYVNCWDLNPVGVQPETNCHYFYPQLAGSTISAVALHLAST